MAVTWIFRQSYNGEDTSYKLNGQTWRVIVEKCENTFLKKFIEVDNRVHFIMQKLYFYMDGT